MAGKGQPLLELRGVSKEYNKKTILENVTLDIFPGEIFGIIGVSGVGKTTLLELLIGFIQPDKGDILLRTEELLMAEEGQSYISVKEDPQRIKQLFGFALQEPSFYKELTVEENLDYFGSLYNLPKKIIVRNIETSLRLVNLEESKKVLAGNLSGGMQKRLDIACALIHNPKVLILDEPTADLDIILRRQMWNLVKKINKQGTTVIIASHFLDEIETLCERIAILHNKTVAGAGKLQDLQNKYAHQEELFIHSIPGKYNKIITAIKKKTKVFSVVEGEQYLKIFLPDAKKVLPEVMRVLKANKEKIITLKIDKPSLNEVFEELTKK